jgi:RNase adapter protein RapZ
VRRPHPLQGEGRLVDGIARERDLLRDVRGEADLVLDTTRLNVHELRAKIVSAFADATEPALHANVVSFGYKYGLPVDADLVVDCRFLPNPHWVPELRPLTGRDPQVRDYVLSQPGAREFIDRYSELLSIVVDGYRQEGKRFVTLAVGCTGGKHRSVAIAEELGSRLRAMQPAPMPSDHEGQSDAIEVQVSHRDLGRE